jgi:DNA-binding HxlR family transcriptional regulator
MTHEDLIMKVMPISTSAWLRTGEIQARIWGVGFERLSRHNLAQALRRLQEAGRLEKERVGRYSKYRRVHPL